MSNFCRRSPRRHIRVQPVRTVRFCSGESAKAPVVVLAMGGGYSTLKSVSAAIKKNIPVLVFAGSGGAADLIAEGYKRREQP